MPRRVIQRSEPRAWFRMTESPDGLTIRDELSGASITIDRDASAGQIRAAKKQLRPQDDPYDRPAKQVVAEMYGTAKQAERDPEPYVPIGSNPKSPYVQRQKELWHAWKTRQEAAKDRQQKLDDDRRIAELAAEHLAKSFPQPQTIQPSWTEPPTWDELVARAEAKSTDESGA